MYININMVLCIFLLTSRTLFWSLYVLSLKFQIKVGSIEWDSSKRELHQVWCHVISTETSENFWPIRLEGHNLITIFLINALYELNGIIAFLFHMIMNKVFHWFCFLLLSSSLHHHILFENIQFFHVKLGLDTSLKIARSVCRPSMSSLNTQMTVHFWTWLSIPNDNPHIQLNPYPPIVRNCAHIAYDVRWTVTYKNKIYFLIFQLILMLVLKFAQLNII